MPLKTYLHQLSRWPDFTWDYEKLAMPLTDVTLHQGKLLGQMKNLGFHLREMATLDAITQDITESSAIEGEHLDLKQVRSSVANRLGIDIGISISADRNVEGIVGMMLDATQNFREPLTTERLSQWHIGLFPNGQSGFEKIVVGRWREGPMRVVSGPMGKEKVHYEAPEASAMDREMAAFLNWYNGDAPIVPVLKAALAHLWFVSIHPLDDGNGRIARAIADMSLARADGTSQRFYSMSAQIRKETSHYYRILEETQDGTLDITRWMQWFLECLDRALHASDMVLELVLRRERFWRQNATFEFSDRQRKVIDLLFDGFEGNLNAAKWAKITKSSHDTALRDISALVEAGVLVKSAAGGRSTSYSLAEV